MVYLIWDPLQELLPIFNVASVKKNQRLDNPGSYGKAKYYPLV